MHSACQSRSSWGGANQGLCIFPLPLSWGCELSSPAPSTGSQLGRRGGGECPEAPALPDSLQQVDPHLCASSALPQMLETPSLHGQGWGLVWGLHLLDTSCSGQQSSSSILRIMQYHALEPVSSPSRSQLVSRLSLVGLGVCALMLYSTLHPGCGRASTMHLIMPSGLPHRGLLLLQP